MARTRPVAPAADPFVNALLSGRAWARDSIGYALVTEPPSTGPFQTAAVTAPSPALVTALGRAVAHIEAVIDLDLVETAPEEATIRIFQADQLPNMPGGPAGSRAPEAYAFFPGDHPAAGDVWIRDFVEAGNGTRAADAMAPGSFGYRALLHELAHALGLREPDRTATQYGPPAERRSAPPSIMTAHPGSGAPDGTIDNAPSGFAETLLTADIAALQHIYGADRTVRDDHYVLDPGERHIQRTLWDSGGHDILDVTDYATPLSIDLRPGRSSTTGQEPLVNHAAVLDGADPIRADGALHMAFLPEGDRNALIEDLFGGAGNDTLIGNITANRIEGRHGDDRILGLGGADDLRGGPGNDRLSGGAGPDALRGGNGDDTLTGNHGSDALFGGPGDDALHGGPGDDRLMGGPGRDTLAGGPGDDTLTGGGGIDVFAFDARGGRDVITDFDAASDRLDVPDPGALAPAVNTDDGARLVVAHDTTVLFEGLSAAALADVTIY